MLKRVTNYIKDNSFKITIINNNINIDNYTDIISIEKDRISLFNDKKIIVIKGKNLLLKKILDNELLITGYIKSIDLE